MTGKDRRGASDIGPAQDVPKERQGADPAVRLVLPATAAAVPEARRALAALCEHSEGMRRDALVCLSEVITGAVRRARGSGSEAQIGLRAELREDRLRVDVLEPEAGDEELPADQLGVLIVDRLTDRWGVDRNGRVTVWFEIDCTPASLRRKAMLFRHISDAVLVLDLSDRIVDWNPASERLFGYSREEVLGRTPDFMLGGDWHVAAGAESGRPVELSYTRADGSPGEGELAAVPLLDEEGDVTGWTLLVRDHTEHREAQRRLLRAEEKFRRVVEAAPDAIVGVKPSGEIVLLNKQAEHMLGYTREELIGRPADLVWPEQLRGGYAGWLERSPRSHTPEQVGRLIGRRKDGSEFPAELWINVLESDDEPLILCSARDVTEQVRLEQRLEYLADHDELTGLLNRRGFKRELGQWLAYASRYGGDGAALALDLDGFKAINDSLGHKAGDLCLVTVATTLRNRLRETDIVARLGGDEFAVVLPNADEQQAQSIAIDVKEMLARGTREHEGIGLPVTASVGIASLANGTVKPDSLIEAADAALCRAKQRGRDCVVVVGAR